MGAGQEGAAGVRAEVGGVRADCQDAPRHGRLGLLWGSSSISHKPVGCVVMAWMSLIVTARMAIDLSREGGSVRKGCAAWLRCQATAAAGQTEGRLPLLDRFEGRRQVTTYCSMFARNAGPAVVAPPTNRRSVHDR